MKISLQWLNDYIQIDDYLGKPQALAQILTDAGLEVEAIEDLAKPFNNVVIGLILEKAPHPDADRLTVCQVTTGEGVIHQIVCGAKNHQAEDRVVVALPGAVLPGNFEIKKSKIRGIESAGMLCSERELGLKDESEGILILPKDAPVGRSFAQYQGLNDILLELKVTPNRADCLSHLGLARELSCLLGRELKPFRVQVQEAAAATGDFIQLQVKVPELCPRYAGRVLKNVKVGPTPAWMKNRLESVGVRSINNVVDITNYVMMELGQPLHAFDIRDLEGHKINVDHAQKNETFTTLDGTEIKFTGDEMVIRDARKPVALAGIVGGLNSGIKDDTKDIFIESAYFQQGSVRRTSRKFGIQTDSAYRFSRGVNPEAVPLAMNRASQLILEFAGGEALAHPHDHYPNPIERSVIDIHLSKVAESLGYAVDESEFIQWMKRLGCELTGEKGVYQVTAPAFRWDLTMDMDLVEEFARLHGYQHIPESLPALDESPSKNILTYDLENYLRLHLQGQGYLQAVNPSFLSSKFQAAFLGNVSKLQELGLQVSEQAVKIVNPLNEDLDVMRTSLAPSLAQNLLHNSRYGNSCGRVFEIGYSFKHKDSGYDQEHRLGLVAWGQNQGLWQKSHAPLVLQLKEAIENLLCALHGRNWQWQQFETNDVPDFLHPGQAARLLYEGKVVGFIGALHPLWRDENKIREEAALAEFNLGLLLLGQPRATRFHSVAKFPVVERDLAFLMPKELPAGEVHLAIQKAGGALLQSVSVFDQYEGDNLPAGQKSVAYRLRYQDPNGTLSEEQITQLQTQVINSVSQKYSISVR